ncbi:MAG: hypothetical protein HIU57_03180 [Acidobacteria bacterium]|nr:hypothetical protein [Acidobacteriota bacterium]
MSAPRPRLAARRLAALVATCALLVTGGPARVAHAAATAAPRSFASEPAHQIVTTALSTAVRSGSVTASSATTISGQKYSLVTISSVTSGQQTLRVGATTTVVRVADGDVYINDTAAAIQAQFGVSAPHYANRWIKITPSSSYFTHFNSFILLPSLLSEVAPNGVLKTTKMLTLDKTSVVGVTGRPNIHLGLASGSETLYVATRAPHVPVELVAADVVQGQREVFVITFTHWGQRANVSKPATSTPISSTSLPR